MEKRLLKTIDVIILSWNRCEDTVAAIESALNQIDVIVNVWIVDQGSTPECLRVLRNYVKKENVYLYEAGKNLGVAGGRNLAISLGSSPYIVSIDNDAVFERADSLKQMLISFSTDSTIGAIGFRVKNFYTRQDDLDFWVYPRSLERQVDKQFYTTRFAGGAHALLRSAVVKTKLYDERLFFNWEELDISYQLIEAGYRILYDPRVVVLHKASPEARVSWEKDRYYYLVRNAIFLRYKYFRNPLEVVLYASGYIVKAIRNRILFQALRGIFDAMRLISTIDKSTPKLSKNALNYVYNFDVVYRGTWLDHLKLEVLKKVR